MSFLPSDFWTFAELAAQSLRDRRSQLPGRAGARVEHLHEAFAAGPEEQLRARCDRTHTLGQLTRAVAVEREHYGVGSQPLGCMDDRSRRLFLSDDVDVAP